MAFDPEKFKADPRYGELKEMLKVVSEDLAAERDAADTDKKKTKKEKSWLDELFGDGE